LGGAEDAVADFVFWVAVVGEGCRDADDYACKLRPGDPGEWWLVLVFSSDLEEIEEIRRCGMDSYYVLILCGLWIGELCYLEVAGPLGCVSVL
jgi:hypothetical protein